jgi:hypothetical protein
VLKIGLLTDGAELRLFDAELVRKIQSAGIAEIVLIVQQELPGKSLLKEGWRALKRGTLIRSVAFRVAVRIERWIIAIRKPEINDVFRTIPIDQVCSAARLPVKPIVSRSGYVHRFATDDVEAIKSRKLDLMLRMGRGILRGDILNAASNGIISYHHGDNRTHRGGPPGFWEALEERDYTGFVIQKLTEELDAGEVLMRGEVATKPTYLLNQYHLYKASIVSMIDLLTRMQREGASGRTRGIEAIDWYSNLIYTTPSVANTLRYLQLFFWRILARIIRTVLMKRDVWELRLLDADWRKLVLWKAQVLSPPRGKFWADPFIVSRSHQKAIFFEEYEFEHGKGHIAALVSAGDGSITYAGPVIQAPYHLSFPYVFRFQGDYYMCPETQGARSVQLWRCTSWPLQWGFHKTILSDVNAVDTMIFERDGRWWLLTNLDRDGTGDFSRELHVYHSASPLSEMWTPLPANPVVTGASRARNAGLLFGDGKIYRLAQSQGFDRYGRSIKLFEITSLSERGYSETLIAELLPNRGLNATGIHHLSACEDTVVFDAQRPRFFWTRVPSLRFSRTRLCSPKPLQFGGRL